MPNAKLLQSIGDDTGVTVYTIGKCILGVNIGKYFNDADGTFVTPAPADPYASLTEDGTIKGFFSKDESRAVWADGVYIFISYTQAGGSEVPATDTRRGIQNIVIQNDMEISLQDVDTEVDALRADYTTARAVKLDNLSGDAYARLGAPAGASVSADVAAVKVDTVAIKAKTDNLPNGVKKNAALSNFPFFMVDSSDGKTAKTGLTVTAKRSIDGGAFAACANTPTEVAYGLYSINLAASDLNGDVIALLFTATNAIDRELNILTQT